MNMDEEPVRFAVTPWRHRAELLQLRTDLYRRGEGAVDARAAAVNKVGYLDPPSPGTTNQKKEKEDGKRRRVEKRERAEWTKGLTVGG
jgi:hypothetical protein